MNNIRKVLELSTGHLPERAAQQIGAGSFPHPCTFENEYAWIFSVPDREEIYMLDPQQLTPEFCRILSMASDMGCDWVLFDRDVEPLPWLMTFDW